MAFKLVSDRLWKEIHALLPPEGAPRNVQAMLRDNVPPLDSKINFTDIGKVVDAFKKIAYAEVGPTTCP